MSNPVIGLVGRTHGGKSTLILEMMKRFPHRLGIVRSVTTRAKRAGLEDEHFYEFVSAEEFDKRRSDGRWVQTVEYAGNRYGTDREHLRRVLADRAGITALTEDGVLNLRAAGYHVVAIRVVPVHDEELLHDPRRAAADAEREGRPVAIDYVLENSFRQGGLERTAAHLAALCNVHAPPAP